jgi:hypothetical protein
MKTIVISLVLLVANTITIFAQTTKDPYVFKVGEKYNLFGDNINIRQEPNTTSDIVVVLPITSKVEILEKTNLTLQINGAEWSFYKVQSNSVIGYVPGGLLVPNERFEFVNKDYKIFSEICGQYEPHKKSHSLILKKRIDESEEHTKRIIYFESGTIIREDDNGSDTYFSMESKYYIPISYYGFDNLSVQVIAQSDIMLEFLKENEDFINSKKDGMKEGRIEREGPFGSAGADCYIEIKGDYIIFGYSRNFEI